MPNPGSPRKAPRMPDPGEKWCAHCLRFKPLDEFGGRSEAYNPRKPTKKAAWCLSCLREYNREWRRRNPDKTYHSSHNEIVRKTVLDHYGGKCRGCGITDYDVLCVDHIDHRLAKQQKRDGLPRGGTKLWKQIIADGFPKDYQLLCYNCNWKKVKANGENLRRNIPS